MRLLRLLIALIIVQSLILTAQNSGPLEVKGRAGSGKRFRADGNLVLVNATVVDAAGRLVTGLDRNQFRLLDDRREEPLISVALEEAPVSVVVVLDVSGSLKHDVDMLRSAMKVFLDSLRPDDEVCLVTFRDEPTVAVPFTGDLSALRSAAREMHAEGGTALLDAMVLGIAQSRARRETIRRRRALVLFTDAGENNSRYTWREVRELAREADMRVYPFVVWSAQEDFALDQVSLRDIADDTGGRLFAVSRSERLPAEVAKLELHAQYVLGFVPGSNDWDGRFRRVKVELQNTPKEWRVYWKHGYRVPVD